MHKMNLNAKKIGHVCCCRCDGSFGSLFFSAIYIIFILIYTTIVIRPVNADHWNRSDSFDQSISAAGVVIGAVRRF